jgi:hypothetical protein
MHATVKHHPECDGYRFEHIANVIPAGPGMVRAECDRCDWRGETYGPDAKGAAIREANDHVEEVRCDGRCQDGEDG